jgi:hypothetical protein
MNDMPTIDDRLAALESENQRLRAEISDMRQNGIRKTAIPVRTAIERQVTVTEAPPTSSFVMPTADERS